MKIVNEIYVMDKDVTRESIVKAAPEVQTLAKAGRIKGFVAFAHGIPYGLDVIPLAKGKTYQDLTELREQHQTAAPVRPQAVNAGTTQLKATPFTAPGSFASTEIALSADQHALQKDREVAMLRAKLNDVAVKLESALHDLRR